MFDKNFEQRLLIWKNFRDSLETSEDPIQDTIDFFRLAPITNIAADPYDQKNWPDPWEIIQENIFCPFVKILAICYTLQLTDKFSHVKFEINIVQDKERSSTYYLLFVDDRVVGFKEHTHVHRSEIPKFTISDCRYSMPHLQ